MTVTDEYVFYWTKNDFPSHWYPAGFHYKGFYFATVEHFMMVQKAILFEMSDKTKQEIAKILSKESRYTAWQILQTSDPKEAKQLGRQVKWFNKKVWEDAVKPVLFLGNLLKYRQDGALQAMLLRYPNRVFVEASPYDKIYGIGLSDSDDRIHDPTNWKGTNWAGEAVTAVRDYIGGQNVRHS